ncbi:hypothetical protein TRVA0_039S01024 [Trichomonascus vanleenenianus]|uniref:uncharacterized protein n=1 Tax=Trichomonascus vanleenenianus TaxID=2268995 RepID=UPI003EC984D7
MLKDKAAAIAAHARDNPVATAVVMPLIALLAYFLINEVVRRQARIKGFSGPTNWPIIGNLWAFRFNAAETYRKWSEKYGPVYQIQLGNIPVIVVNTAEYASKVFITNSHATISRPTFYTFHKVVSTTAGTTIGTTPYSESLKRRRKAAATALNRPAVQSYVPHIDLETKEFIEWALDIGERGKKPFNPGPLAAQLSLNLSLTLNWGTRTDKPNDPLIKEITEVEEYVSKFRSTTGNLQDYVPILRYNPFSGHSKLAVEMRERRDRYLRKLNKELDERIANKTYTPCIQANVLLDPEAKLNAEELMSISLTMLSAGLDTITTALCWGCAILADRPDIQEKAYSEIRKMFTEDEILCDPVEDHKCKYVAALVREVLRVYNPLRLSLPKCAEEDFYIDGKLVPKGTTLFLNSWACNMDPALYPEPHEFRPERFVEKPSTPIFTYGYGTRMCAGFMLGNRELYLLFMRMISCFKIEKVEEMDMDPLTGTLDPAGLVSLPHPYKVRFVPRDLPRLEKALAEYTPVASG